MNDGEWIGKIHSSMDRQCKARGYAAPVDVLMDAGVLSKQKYEEWRLGRVPFLESVCMVNLHRLTFILHEMRVYARKNGLKPSFCYYKQWAVKKKNGQGHKPVIPLRFTKSGNPEVEKSYATHFVDPKRIAELKAENRTIASGVFLPKNQRHLIISAKNDWKRRKSMNKSELVRAIGSKTEMTNSSAERALNAVIETLTEALSAGDKVKLVDFGSFEVRTRSARTARNPRTGEKIEIGEAKLQFLRPVKR